MARCHCQGLHIRQSLHGCPGDHGILQTRGLAEQGLVIGYDRRFLSKSFAERVAEVAAGNGIPVPENLAALLTGHDVVIDAIDQARVKVAMAAWCVENGVPLVMAGAAGGKTGSGQTLR